MVVRLKIVKSGPPARSKHWNTRQRPQNGRQLYNTQESQNNREIYEGIE